jgi:glycerol kinase
MADMFNVEIKRLKVSDATIVGAVILAGVGAEIFADVVDGVNKVVNTLGIYMFNEVLTGLYV